MSRAERRRAEKAERKTEKTQHKQTLQGKPKTRVRADFEKVATFALPEGRVNPARRDNAELPYREDLEPYSFMTMDLPNARQFQEEQADVISWIYQDLFMRGRLDPGSMCAEMFGRDTSRLSSMLLAPIEASEDGRSARVDLGRAGVIITNATYDGLPPDVESYACIFFDTRPNTDQEGKRADIGRVDGIPYESSF